ncbi:MAG: carboxymuconolactone decarboxylase family protein [Stellaceae bacterium]
MARLPYLQQSDLAPEDRDLLAPRASDGSVPNLYRVLVHGPAVMRKQNALAMHIRHDSRLDPRLRELAILQVGYMTRQPYEYSHHVKLALEFGCSEDDIRALADETAGRETNLDPVARLVLRAAREMTDDRAMSAATFAALHGELDNDRLMELIIAIATYNGVIRILGTLQIDVEDSYQPYLEKFPLQA